MQSCRVALSVALLAAPVAASQSKENPLGKVIQLVDDLAAKVKRDGEVEAKAYAEYTEWCDSAATNAKFAIEDATKEKAKLEALIAERSSDISVADGRIGDLAASIASGEADLKNAGTVRSKEVEDFLAAEGELAEAVDALGRALGVLQREMAKNPALLQQVDLKSTDETVKALSAILDAASFSTSDTHKLQSLLQAQQQEQASDDDAPGAPDAATYKSHSSNIVDVLEDMKEKAEGQLSDLRKAESNAKHNYEMLRQSLEAQRDADNKDLDKQKVAKAKAAEDKAAAEGDLERTTASLATAQADLKTSQTTCMTVAGDHEATVAARNEELKVIAEARQVLVDTSAGAVSQTYSFLQSSLHSSLQSRADLAQSEVVALVRDLARKHHSSALAQLASRIAAVTKYGGSSSDVFGKVKGMLRDMITKLEREAESEATEKSYCDSEMAKTEAKKSDLEDDIARHTANIDQKMAKSANLKTEVRTLEGELAALAKEQAEMDKLRQEENAAYSAAKTDLELGLSGVRKAVSALRNYYGNADGAAMLQDDKLGAFMQQPAAPEQHSKSGGAGSSIIGLLEVVESDFANNLAKEESQEADAQSAYERTTQENKISRTTKEQDVKYKTQSAESLDSIVAEVSSDRQTANTEYSAVLEYHSTLKERCTALPQTYEERAARRTAEIDGLKQALSVLNDETAFVQRKNRSFRGFRGHALAAQ